MSDESAADGDEADSRITVPVPSDYDESQADAFRKGFQACAQLFGHAAETYFHAAGGDEPADGDDDEPACDECGADPLPSMGADETCTPAGTVCPDCEL